MVFSYLMSYTWFATVVVPYLKERCSHVVLNFTLADNTAPVVFNTIGTISEIEDRLKTVDASFKRVRITNSEDFEFSIDIKAMIPLSKCLESLTVA